MTKVRITERTRRKYGEYPNHGTLLCWQWCIDTLGKPKPFGDRWTWDTELTFEFKDAEDAIMFRLLWA